MHKDSKKVMDMMKVSSDMKTMQQTWILLLLKITYTKLETLPFSWEKMT